MAKLLDISIEHTYKGKKAHEPLTFTMHPFTNTQGAYQGLFEILRDILETSKKRKRSAHVTVDELAELYARELLEQYAIRLRLRPVSDDYPEAPPGKKVPRHCVVTGSDFDRLIKAVDVRRPISAGLRTQLQRLGLTPST
jgi:hypothetical protein